jgi:hypothetical protein
MFTEFWVRFATLFKAAATVLAPGVDERGLCSWLFVCIFGLAGVAGCDDVVLRFSLLPLRLLFTVDTLTEVAGDGCDVASLALYK